MGLLGALLYNPGARGGEGSGHALTPPGERGRSRGGAGSPVVRNPDSVPCQLAVFLLGSLAKVPFCASVSEPVK